ncbi:MAG: hypothetical protein AAFS10_09555 [Myxococcota bacterium]
MARLGVDDGFWVTISDTAIDLNGREKVPLDASRSVDVSHKRGGVTSLYIQKVFNALLEYYGEKKHMARLKGHNQEPILIIVCAPTTRSRTLLEVLYTADQAGFGAAWVMSLSEGGWKSAHMTIRFPSQDTVIATQAKITSEALEYAPDCKEPRPTRRFAKEVEICYRDALTYQPDLAGALTITWTLAADNHPTDISAHFTPSLQHTHVLLDRCLERHFAFRSASPPPERPCTVTERLHLKATPIDPKSPPASVAHHLALSPFGTVLVADSELIEGCKGRRMTQCIPSFDVASLQSNDRAKRVESLKQLTAATDLDVLSGALSKHRRGSLEFAFSEGLPALFIIDVAETMSPRVEEMVITFSPTAVVLADHTKKP